MLLHYRFDSALGEDEALTQLLVLKLYRERQGSAFETWAAAGEPDLTALVPQVLPTAAVAAAGEVFSNSDGSSCVSAGKTLLQGVLAEHKKVSRQATLDLYAPVGLMHGLCSLEQSLPS